MEMTTQTITRTTTFDESQFFEVITDGPATPTELADALDIERYVVQERLQEYTRQEWLVFDEETGRYWNS
jgi:hypothetical protein